MSVIIPNMKMPMSCLACPLAREMFNCLVCVGYFKDNLTGRRVYKSDLKESDADFNRPDWCPLLPLPEKHGRLIDASKLWKAVFEMYGNEIDETEANVFMELIGKAQTIIEAEGGGEE